MGRGIITRAVGVFTIVVVISGRTGADTGSSSYAITAFHPAVRIIGTAHVITSVRHAHGCVRVGIERVLGRRILEGERINARS